MSAMKVTTIQYLFRAVSSWKGFELKVDQSVEIAAQNKTKLVLFPEYLSSELFFLFLHEKLESQLEKLQEFFPKFLELFQKLAKDHQLYICAGTFPTKVGDKFRNRSYVFSPSGHVDFQDKLQLSQEERHSGLFEPGDAIKVFATPQVTLAIAISYDSEFSPVCRKQVESGAELLLVPSFSKTAGIYNQVEISCKARALENGCFVMTAATQGASPWGGKIDTSFGSCGIFSPTGGTFPANGIIATGSGKEKLELCHADLNFEELRSVRKTGNYAEWKFLPPLLEKPTTTINL